MRGIRKLFATAVGVAAALVAPTVATGRSSEAGLAADDALERAILVEVNEVRAAHRLPPLHLSVRLSAAAHAHSVSMSRRGVFAHALPGGPSVLARLRRFYPSSGFRRWSVGENLAAMSPELEAGEAVDMWMQSPPHRRNLLSRQWRELGLGAVHAASVPGALFAGEAATFVTADFGIRT